MKSPAGYFILGALVASVFWLFALTVLGDKLLNVFSHFGGH